MSWALASLVILLLALAVGFAWYERSRPPSRVLALAAALAALAVVGRVAFAPIPNVKPTTDIVLMAGLALGGAPGFAVGAVTALVSNLFFGQGPWTAWQMAAWGGVGVAGGLLGRSGREPGRLGLAVACGLAGAAFGMVMDVYQWTLAAEQTGAAYLAIAATSLPYNAAHVIGNVAFALLLGPAILRALARYQRRFELRWQPAAAAAAAAAIAASLALPAGALASPAGQRAADYLERSQNADGGFGAAPRQASSGLYTGWAALGLAGAGRDLGRVDRGSRSVVDALRAQGRGLRDTGDLERTLLALSAAGLEPRLGRRDLLAELRRRRRRDGSWDGAVSLTAFGVLALRAAGESSDRARMRGSARWLERRAQRDGGFGLSANGPSDVDITGAVLQALVAAGRGRGAAVRRAVGYLRRAQGASGGLGATPDGEANAQSTAWAVQGLLAAGRDPERLRRGGRSPLDYLRSLQRSDGSVRYSRASAQTPVWVTAQAALALERRPFPLRPPPRSRRRTSAAGSGTPSAAPRAAETRSAPPAEEPTAPVARSSPERGDSERSEALSPGAGPSAAASSAGEAASPEAAPADPSATAPAASSTRLQEVEPAAAARSTSSGSKGPELAAAAAAAFAVGALWWRRRRLHAPRRI